MGKAARVVPQHRAKRAKGPGARPWSGSRGETHCGYRAKPCRSLRQSLNRRKPTRCRLNYKKQKKVVLYYKVISEQKSAPFSLSLSKCKSAKSVAILRHDKLSRIICRGEQPVLRICHNSEL